MPLPVTALYAALLGLVLLVLSGLTGQMRGKSNVSLGDGGNPRLLEAIRRHGNFIEYVPYIVLMMAIIELNGAPKGWLHGLGLPLLAGRIIHPFGMSAERMNMVGRFVGMMLTFIVALACVLILGWQALR